MFQTVLLPIDVNDPESWKKALPMARRCAGTGGKIHVLGIVHDLGMAIVASFLPEGFEKQALEKLRTDLQTFAEAEFANGTGVEVHVGYGQVAETILKVSAEIGADLIVMASHPPNDLSTFLIGSQAGKVVRNATLPVLVVR